MPPKILLDQVVTQANGIATTPAEKKSVRDSVRQVS